MQSKLCARLFFAGEVIDADGPCGGYNLQMCWSTGALAGREAARAAVGQQPARQIKDYHKPAAKQHSAKAANQRTQ